MRKFEAKNASRTFHCTASSINEESQTIQLKCSTGKNQYQKTKESTLVKQAIPKRIEVSANRAEQCQPEGSGQRIEHDILLQLVDSAGFPVENTEFWVTITLLKVGSKVTIDLPVINFQTGQVSQANPFYPNVGAVPGIPPNGGYLYTVDGFLPEPYRPSDIVPRSIIAASDNGMSPLFSFTQDPATLPKPPSGYIVQITDGGELIVQCSGTFGNIIPTGPQILLPCEVSYIVGRRERLFSNFKISTGVSDITTDTGEPVDIGFRDNDTNDVFDSIAAWAWIDNSTATPTSNATNIMVAVGSVNPVTGQVKVGAPVQLTMLTEKTIFCAAVAINRIDKKNIVVSYRVANNTRPRNRQTCRAVSFDGGVTWPALYDGVTPQPLNGPIDGIVTVSNDNAGVKSDIVGHIWYSRRGNPTPTQQNGNVEFLVSVDKGVTFTLVFQGPVPPNPTDFLYDYPQYTFGGDISLDTYGLYYQVSRCNLVTNDCLVSIGFIPIHGFGLQNIDIANSIFTVLPQLSQAQLTADIAASKEGKIWIQSNCSGLLPIPFSYIQPILVSFKSSRGSLADNWAGPWDLATVKNSGPNYFLSGQAAEPAAGFIPASTQSIVYDDKRKALYALVSTTLPFYSQNMAIYFVISRDNGQTWSKPIRVNTSDRNNRGFQSMALDPITGHLITGFYDGRNVDETAVEYFGASLPARILDKLVNAIPLSDPQFVIPAVSQPIGVINNQKLKATPNRLLDKSETRRGN